MTDRLKFIIKHLLREASDMGNRGFYFEDDREKQAEDWAYFENNAVKEILEAINDR